MDSLLSYGMVFTSVSFILLTYDSYRRNRAAAVKIGLIIMSLFSLSLLIITLLG